MYILRSPYTCVLWHDETVTKPRRNRDETTRVLSMKRRNHHFYKIKIYYIYIILYRIWWFRRLIDKNRVVSSWFRRGFVVEVRMAKPSIHLRSIVNGAVDNQRRSIDARTISGQQYTVHSTQYTVQSTRYLLHGTESTAHSQQYTVHSTQFTVQSESVVLYTTTAGAVFLPRGLFQ